MFIDWCATQQLHPFFFVRETIGSLSLFFQVMPAPLVIVSTPLVSYRDRERNSEGVLKTCALAISQQIGNEQCSIG